MMSPCTDLRRLNDSKSKQDDIIVMVFIMKKRWHMIFNASQGIQVKHRCWLDGVYRCSAGGVLFHVLPSLLQERLLPNIQPIRRCLRGTPSGSAALFRELWNPTSCG